MRRSLSAWSFALLVVLAGCTPAEDRSSAPVPGATPTPSTGSEPAPDASPSTATSPAPAGSPAARPSPSPTPSPRPSRKPNPVSVQALIQKEYDGDNLRRGRLLSDNGAYRRYLVTYRSEKLRVSGVMAVPDGDGPFPVVVMNHGYIDPDAYVPGQGMPREQDYFARNGYVVLHVDYRGHASGDDDPDVDYELRLPYAVDTVNAVYAVKRSGFDYLDEDRVAWLGRSMGGNVTLNALVAQPGLVDAASIYASTSSRAAQNWEQFYRPSEDRDRVNRRIERSYGLPDDNPEFWLAASPLPYFDRITEPLLVHHGLADDTCPVDWSREIVRTLRKKDKDVTYYSYAGAGHTFEGATWQRSIRRTKAFFDRELG